MKLSEAIRLGAMLAPQGFGHYRSDDGTCAIGAAKDALGDTDAHALWRVIEDKLHSTCPLCGLLIIRRLDGTFGNQTIIPHLNDHHRWTREQIADFVETVEPALSTTVEVQTAVDAVGLSVVQPVAVHART